MPPPPPPPRGRGGRCDGGRIDSTEGGGRSPVVVGMPCPLTSRLARTDRRRPTGRPLSSAAVRVKLLAPCVSCRPTSTSWYSFRSAHDALSPCALSDLPDGRSFSCPDTFGQSACRSTPTPTTPQDDHRSSTQTQGAPDETDRSPGPHQEPRDAGGGGHVRPPRRRHPARLRPDPRLVDPPHPGAPRAGRRPHGRGLRPGHRPARRGHGDERARAPPTSSRRWPTPTWTRSRWS